VVCWSPDQVGRQNAGQRQREICPRRQFAYFIGGRIAGSANQDRGRRGAQFASSLVPLDARAAELLAGIPYTGSSIWTFIYDRAGVKHPLNGFGFLVPSLERRSIMACTWVGTKWVGRVPGDKVVLRCFSTNPAATRDAIESDLARLMDISAAPLAAINHRWPDSMPQYTVGHMMRIAELERRIAQIPGLFSAGNAFHGIGIPDCVRSGRDAARAITKFS
jgi:protoporphyrinogen/coproporphyrinogen III oxidase